MLDADTKMVFEYHGIYDIDGVVKGIMALVGHFKETSKGALRALKGGPVGPQRGP